MRDLAVRLRAVAFACLALAAEGVDHAEISVRGMLTAGWQLVERLAEIVAREGKADAETITRVFSGPSA